MTATAPHHRSSHFMKEWFFLAGALLLVGGFFGWTLFSAHSATEARERDHLAAQAKIVHDSISRQLDAVARVLQSNRDEFLRWQQMPDGLARASQRLRAFADAMPGVRTLLILDAGGTVVAASRAELVGKNFSQRNYFQTPLQQPDVNRLYIGEPFKTALNVWAINVVRILTGHRGEFAGIVSATLDPNEFKPLIDSVNHTPDMWSALVHGDGKLFLIMPEHPELTDTDLASAGSFFTRHQASRQATSVLTGQINDTYRMLAQHTVQPPALNMDKPLVVAVSRDVAAIYANWHEEARARSGLFALLTLTSVIALFLLQRRQRFAEFDAAVAENALREKSQELERFFGISLDLMCIADFSGRFRKLNPAWEHILGYSVSELEGANFIDFVHPDDQTKTRDTVAVLATGGSVINFINRYRTKNGTYRCIEWHSVPYEKRLIYAAARDVTESQAREQQLREAFANAEAANRAKSQFLANMSHEIRTPMSGVLGLLELLQQTPLTDRQLGYTQQAQTAARSLLSILNDILDFSKVEAGRLDLEKTDFHLDQVMDNLAAMLGSAAQEKNVTLRFDLDATLPSTLHGDALRLQQVLLNLAGNGVKFTAQGQVVVSVRLLTSSAASARIEFAVSDTGIGIPSDMLCAIFEGFTQAEASTSRRFGGTGLGLAISQRLVRLMGGNLAVDSRAGHGSRFYFTLDLPHDGHLAAIAAQPAAAAFPLGTRPLSGLRLLVVEDNLVNQQVARELMSNKGAYVETASNGQQGIDHVALAHQPFDAVLMDLQMPVMDGFEATRILREELGLETLPIIAMTANAMAADRAACLAAGMNDHIGKPVDLTELVNTLLRHCTRASTLDGNAAATSPTAPTLPTPPMTTMPTLPADFALEAALARLDNNRALYAQLVSSFRTDSQTMLARIHAQWPAGDLTTVMQQLHTLKGLAGTLGATTLATFAKEAETAIKAGRSNTDLLDQLAALLDNALAMMETAAAHFSPAASPLATLADTARVIAHLDQLDVLLQQNNLRALDLQSALQQECGSALGDTLKPLNQAMAAMNFSAALTASRVLRDKLAA